jgi:HEAT repeat protein
MALAKEVEERWSRMLKDSDPETQMDALTEIGRSYFRAPRGTEKLTLPRTLRDEILGKLESEDVDMQAEAVLALVHWQDEKTADAIRDALIDGDIPVRLAAIQTAAMVKPDKLVWDIVKVAREDKEEVVRAQAVDAIRSLNERASRENIVDIEEITLGPTRTSGRTLVDLSQVLDDIRKKDKSSYVRFMAG